MKKFFSKTIDASKLQTRATDDLKLYQKELSSRGKHYSKQSQIPVSKCYLCGSVKKTDLVTVFGSTYVKCLNCTHVYLLNRLTDSQLSRFYTENESYATTYTEKRQIKYRQEHVAKPKIKFALNHMAFTGNKQKTWLDVGCAIGDVVDVINHETGWRATGIDISESSIKTGKTLFNSDLRQILFKQLLLEEKGLCFNVISFFGYLGLISDPMEELKLARTHIKRGGYVVIGEENASSFSSIVQQSNPELSTRHLIPPNAVQMFTPTSLEKALVKSGFKPIASWYFGLDFVEFVKSMSLKDKQFSESPTRHFFLQHANQFQQVIDSLELSDYMIMVAKASP